MPEYSEAYILGLLTDVSEVVPRLDQSLSVARRRAAAVDGELSSLIERLDQSRQALAQAERQRGRSALEINETNLRIASLHQEVAGIKRRSEDIKTEMDRVGPGAIQRRLRRERAKLSVQVDDREQEIATVRQEGDEARAVLQAAEKTAVEEKDRGRVIVQELDKLQSQLPDPAMMARLFEARAGLAHCDLVLGGSPEDWRVALTEASELMFELHRDLRRGKYRLDTNSELIGGRSMASAEAVFGLVALDNPERAEELFELVVEPSLYFHDIFNVFRVWCLGHYLQGNRSELLEILRHHQYADGLRGGYVQAFIGLSTGKSELVEKGLRRIVRHEWEVWSDPSLVRAAGVVNLGAVALCKLAHQRGMKFASPGPTVPRALFQKSIAAP